VASMLIESTIAMTARRLLDEQPAPVEEDTRLLMEVFLQGITLDQRRSEGNRWKIEEKL